MEQIDSATGTVTTYMGECGQSGRVYSGHRTNDVKVYWMFGIAVHEEEVFVSLYEAKKILQVVGDTVAVLADMQYETRHLTLLADGVTMYFSYNFGVGVMNVENTSSITYICGTETRGSKLGSLEESRFTYISEVLPVSDKLIIFNQHEDNRSVTWNKL